MTGVPDRSDPDLSDVATSASTVAAGDDLAAFVPQPGAGHGQTIRVPWVPDAVGLVRRAIVADLLSRGVAEQTIDEAELVASELVTNSIRHARPRSDGRLRVHWKVRFEVVEVEVTDGGAETTPRPAPHAVWADSGRGLRIVRSLAHEWGVNADKSGVTVWAALGGPSRRRAH